MMKQLHDEAIRAMDNRQFILASSKWLAMSYCGEYTKRERDIASEMSKLCNRKADNERITNSGMGGC